MKKFGLIFSACFLLLLSSCGYQSKKCVTDIKLISTEGLVDTYEIIYSDGTSTNFTITDGEQGIEGKPGTDGHTPSITIGENGNWYIDGVDSGISSKGSEGQKGDKGESGIDGNGISKIEFSHSEGNLDFYQICFDDGTTFEFSIKNGIDGENGQDGNDGLTPYIGENGNWWIGESDTNVKANGEDGKTPTISISEDGYWILNDIKTGYAIGLSISELREYLSDYFVLEDKFIMESKTLNNPSYSYTNSTFSGWTGSIGNPQKINTLSFKVRAREKGINSIKVYLQKDNKEGELISSKLLEVNINPYEEKEIFWTLEKEFINENNDFLYFGYACDQFCDVYSEFGNAAKIPDNEPQSIQAYITNGKQPLTLSSFTDVYGSPCRYIYVELGRIEKKFVPTKYLNNLLHDKVNIYLPDEYYLAVNDNFQLFYRGVIQAVNPYNYYIEIKTKYGKVFPRYYEWKPTINQIGTYELTLNVYDNNRNLLGSDKTKLIVNNSLKENSQQNILCIGDSLTSGGIWVNEAYRRYAESGGNPAGDSKNYLNFIGTKSTTKYPNVGFEGYPGWTRQKFMGAESPFFDENTNKISFKNYVENNSYEDIDYVYILLTWNGMTEKFKTDFNLGDGHFKYAQEMLDLIHSEFPDAKIRLMGLQIPSQNGGMGTNYDVNSVYGDAYGMLVTAMNYNKKLEELSNLDKYKEFVNYIDIAGQFDTDFNMPTSGKPVNNRNEETEIIGSNGVHPTTNGYYQIADAVYRSFYNDFKVSL